MKNIFLISTDKESNLYKCKNGLFTTKEYFKHSVESQRENQFIYITNIEDLTLGGYHFNSKYGDEPQKTVQRDIDSRKYWEEEDYFISKIVLTNDTSLIEDGVQEVNSSFLSFYAENKPDYVEVSSERIDGSYCDETDTYKYDTIFPQKETKQEYSDSYNEKDDELLNKTVSKYLKEKQKEHLIKIMKSDEELGLYENKENWIFERSSGYAGYRNTETNEWIYEDDYLKLFSVEEKLYTKEDLEIAHQMGANFAYGRKEATKTNRLTHFEDWFNTIKK